MLNPQFIRDHQTQVKQACTNKQLDPSVVDTFIATDQTRRELQHQVDQLRQQSNQVADQIKQAVQQGGTPDPELVGQGKAIKTQLKELEPQLREAEAATQQAAYQIPNIPAADVPIGADESGNVVSKTWGKPPVFKFEPQPHHVLMEQLGWLDTKRAVKIGGFRSYFLKGQAVLLEQALLRFALDTLVAAGFTPMTTPVLVNDEAMWGTGYFPWGQEDHYQTQDDSILVGTSEVALTAYHQGETLPERDFPIKMVGISPCFRREIGAHGTDTRGIVRVHQFNKVEQVVYTVADEAETRRWHQQMLEYSEQLLQALKLPYQVLTMCTGDMGAGQRKKFDIETWFPAQQKYRETHSASYFNDFQSRRLNIRYQAKDGTTQYVYTLNNTMAATPRLLAAVIENYQQADGSVAMPAVLRKYL